MTTSLTTGIHHLGLTVPDVESAARFFIEALGFERLMERPDYPAIFVGNGSIMLTLWQAKTDNPKPFDRKTNLGLHHFALTLAPGKTLEEVETLLEKRDDVDIEFSPENLGQGPTRHLMCTVVGGLRMEIIAPKA